MKQDKTQKQNVLVVDDEECVREALKLVLSLDGHTVTQASTGAQAFVLFEENDFDLVITDFQMPGMKGNELAVRIKELSPFQPILMLTAYGNHLGDSDNPVDAILTKPFSLGEFREVMNALLSCAPRRCRQPPWHPPEALMG